MCWVSCLCTRCHMCVLVSVCAPGVTCVCSVCHVCAPHVTRVQVLVCAAASTCVWHTCVHQVSCMYRWQHVSRLSHVCQCMYITCHVCTGAGVCCAGAGEHMGCHTCAGVCAPSAMSVRAVQGQVTRRIGCRWCWGYFQLRAPHLSRIRPHMGPRRIQPPKSPSQCFPIS